MTVLAFVVLSRLEFEFVERGRTTLPIHGLFTLLFVSATFICAAVVGGALGLATGNGRLAIRLALSSGLAAAIAFLALNVLQDLLGRRVIPFSGSDSYEESDSFRGLIFQVT